MISYSSEEMKQTMEAIWAKKEKRRRELAKLSFEEKIDILVQLQHLVSSIRKSVGAEAKKPW